MRNLSVHDGGRSTRSVQRTFRPPTETDNRQRKLVPFQLPSVRPEPEKLATCNLTPLDPAGPLQMKKQLELNIDALLAWIYYSTWVNVTRIMHPLDENPAVNREPNQIPGFLFPSQIATLVLVKTEDLIPLIAPIIWPIFGAVMALRYSTQAL